MEMHYYINEMKMELQTLKRIQHHRVSINGAEPLSGVSSITEEDHKVFKALKVKQPSQTQQMTLL